MIHHSHGFIQEREAKRLADGARRRASAEARATGRAVNAATAGDDSGVAALVDRFADRIRTIARLHRLKPHDVEDVVQATWLRLVERGDSIRDAQAVGAWLETTARRESLRVLRLATRERPHGRELLERLRERRTALGGHQLPLIHRRDLVVERHMLPPAQAGLPAPRRAGPELRRDRTHARHPDREHRPDAGAVVRAAAREPGAGRGRRAMVSGTVIEVPLQLEPVTADPFIDSVAGTDADPCDPDWRGASQAPPRQGARHVARRACARRPCRPHMDVPAADPLPGG